jgi:hypothetical protein
MKSMNRLLVAAGVAAVMCVAGQAWAQQTQGGGGGGQRNGRQGRGNFDPAQFQQRMMERLREQMDVKGDDEWKIIEERVQKVSDARREVGFGGMGRMGFGRGGPGGPGGPGGDTAAGGDQNRRRGFGGEVSPAAQELQQAIEAKASAEQIKAKLAKYREDRKQKQAKLDQAQEDLKKVLSVRQEAVAVLFGYLN